MPSSFDFSVLGARAVLDFAIMVEEVTSQSSNAITVIAPGGQPGPLSVVVTNRDGAYAVAGGAHIYQI
jgi:hypothetical protein